jgi:4-hydroxyphenylpyruvate dioxygenase-like putative hemolysin
MGLIKKRIKKGILETDLITQIGLIVKNIDETSRTYANIFGTKKPPIMETAAKEKTLIEYKGQPTEGRAKLAFFKFKNITLELIEPIGGPSTWQEFLDTHGEGVHHIAFQVKNTKSKIELLAQQGLELEQKGNYTGGHYAYIDGKKSLKLMLELLENDFKKI